MAFAKLVPDHLKYAINNRLRKNKIPYCYLQEGDSVIQVGAPRDILLGGRSRAIHFSMMVGDVGKILIIEPDPESFNALNEFIQKNKISNATTVNTAVWGENTTLEFISNPNHPASNIVKSVDPHRASPASMSITMSARTLDDICEEHSFSSPKMVSVTTNGSEEQALKGMSGLLDGGIKYVALAPPSDHLPDLMANYGYETDALDDRGMTFKKSDV
ncbi:MAG: FkbM family methyltransferase [Pseudomonadales bacterium]|nr:FkbM family methyltransferase [Pseudomonadales bacterium]